MRDALVGPRSFLIVLLALLFASPARANRRHDQWNHQGRTGRRPAGGDPDAPQHRKRGDANGRQRKRRDISLAGCQPGRYDLTAELAGFANAEDRDITITIGLALQRDLTMGLQTLQETVTVTAEAPVIEVTGPRSRRSSPRSRSTRCRCPTGSRPAWCCCCRARTWTTRRSGGPRRTSGRAASTTR